MFFKTTDRNYYAAIMRLLKWSVIIQVIQLAGTFLLTYYFKKEDFGALSFLISISTIFEMAVGLQYNTAAIVNKERSNALSLMFASVVIAIAFSILLLTGIFLLYCFAPGVFHSLNRYGLIATFPLILIANFVFNNGMQLLKYSGKIKEINFFRILYVVAMLAAKIFAALVFASVASLIYAHIFGILVPCLVFAFMFRHRIKKTYEQINFKDLMQLMRQNYRFPRYSIPSNIISAAATISFPILVTIFFGLHENGVYYLTTIFIFQPLLLILQAVSDVFLQKISVMFYENKQMLYDFIKSQQKIIITFIIPYVLIAAICGEFLFDYLLPPQWLEIGKFIKFIALYYIFTSIYTPFSIVADYMNKQRFLMVFNLSLFVFQFCALYFLHNDFTFTFVILVISVITAVHYGFINFYMLRKLKFYT
jgi:O-antigen/teichoic acid export membrane protein